MNRSSCASGKGIGSLVFHGVLRGDHDERGAERVRLRIDRDLALLHALQQGGLRLGRGAVDLVAQHHVGEHGAGAELEVAPLLVEHVHAGDVGRQHVGRELDAPERAIDRSGQRLGQHRLADTGDVLDQEVPLGHQPDERQADLGVLAADDLLDVVLERAEPVAEGLPVASFFTQLQAKPPVSDAVVASIVPSLRRCVTPERWMLETRRTREGDRREHGRWRDRPGRADAPRGPCSQLQASRPGRSRAARLHACDSSREP